MSDTKMYMPMDNRLWCVAVVPTLGHEASVGLALNLAQLLQSKETHWKRITHTQLINCLIKNKTFVSGQAGTVHHSCKVVTLVLEYIFLLLLVVARGFPATQPFLAAEI